MSWSENFIQNRILMRDIKKSWERKPVKRLLILLVVAHAFSLTSVFAEYVNNDLMFHLDSRRAGPRPFYNADTNSPMPTWEGLVPYVYFPIKGINMADFGNLPDWVTDDPYGTLVYHHFKFESNRWGARLSHMPDEAVYGSTRFNYSDDFTVEMWVRPLKSSLLAAGRMHLFGDQTVTGQGYRLTAKEENAGKFLVELEMQDVTGSTARYSCATSAKFNMGEWYQIVGVYDGAPNAVPLMKIYVNGMDQNAGFAGDSTVPSDTDFVPTGSSPNDLTGIGARGIVNNTVSNDSARQYFGGDISIVRLYTNVLTAVGISLNYSNELPRFTGEVNSWLPGSDFHTNAIPEYKLWTNGTHRSQMLRLSAERRVTIAADTNHYLCRADVLQTDSGRLICAFLENSTHSGTEAGGYSSVAVSVSDDNGATWHDPNNPARSYGIVSYGRVNVEGYTHSVVNISWHPNVGSNGTAVINTTAVGVAPFEKAVHALFRSYDEGTTWSTQYIWNVTIGNVAPDRIRTLDNGDWVILGHTTRRSTLWNPSAGSEETILRSKDNGQTWLPVSDLVQSQSHKAWHESSLLDTGGGHLIIYMDDMTWHSYPSFRCYSEDYGYSFSPPVMTPWFGQKNESGLLANGKVLTLFRTQGTEEGFTACLGDPYESNDIMPVTSFCCEQDRIRLYPDRLTLDSGEGMSRATMYTLPPATDPSGQVFFKTRMRCLSADKQACHIDVGLPIMIYTNRIELLTNSAVGFYIDATQWHDYEIDRNGGNLVIKCDGAIRVETNVATYILNSGLSGDPAGRTIKFGNYTYGFTHEKFSKNIGVSEWHDFDVTVASGLFPSYHWQWSVTNNIYPDQFKRDRLIMMETEGASWSTDYGYGGWTQLKDGSIYVVDYTRGEGPNPSAKPFIRGYRLYESDFDPVTSAIAELYLDAADAGTNASNVWNPVIGSGGVLYGHGAAGYKPQPDSDGHIPCYYFTCDQGFGGQVGVLNADKAQFDYDDDFTVETWVKPGKSIASTGRMHIVGNQLAGEMNSACGWRLTARQVNGTNRFFIELTMRDNAGADTNRVLYQVRTAETYPMERWYHIVAIYKGISNAVPMMSIYVNGRFSPLIVQGDSRVPPDGERDFVVPYQEITIGARGRPAISGTDDDRQWFGGYIAMVRLYHEALNNGQVNAVHNEDIDSDGYAAWQEYMTGTDPHDPSSHLQLRFVDGRTPAFESFAQSAYVIEYSDSLVSNSWHIFRGGIKGSGNVISINDTNNAAAMFYRLIASPQQ